MDGLLDAFQALPLAGVMLFALVGDWLAFFLTLAVGHRLARRYRRKPTTPPPEPVTAKELWLATSCVLVNTLIAIAGILLWQHGVIHVRRALDWRVALDVLVLILAMDFQMYVFHRVAHLRWVFPLVHATHHEYNNPRPLTLFVLNPVETAAFGVLWLLVITVYTSSWLAIALYLAFNLAFGLIGHLGVEPLPASWIAIPVMREVSTSTFHAEHHLDAGRNFGFYTLLWDRLFGTISPTYRRDFLGAQERVAAPATEPLSQPRGSA
jgi:sterol desaturase/sphingolipid hydroxylase (fatty acid hydroxylase superfamily)